VKEKNKKKMTLSERKFKIIVLNMKL